MPLTFTKTNVVPGEPVTAQAWNAIVDGLFEVQSILKLSGGVAVVKLTNSGLDLSRARVTASRAGSPPAEALRPIGASQDFIFPELAPGAYEVRAEAPGFAAKTGSLTVADDGTVAPKPLELALDPQGELMPNVLGKPLKEAAPLLQKIKPRLLDAGGKDLPLTGFDSAYADMPVLSQFPAPGEVAPSTGSQVVVGAIIQKAKLVTVPNLIGLTPAQAQTELAKVGLSLKVVS